MASLCLFLAGDGDCGPLHASAAVFDTLGVFRAVLDGVSSVSVSSAQRAGVGAEHGASHLPVRVLQVVRSVETLRLPVVTTEDANLRLLCCGGGQFRSSTPE